MTPPFKKWFTKQHGIVSACTIGNAIGITPMVYTTFGFFLIPLTEEFGWSRSSVSVVLLIVAVASAISYPIIGRAIDRYGARRIILIGNLAFAASIAGVSYIGHSLWMLYLAYACIGIAGAITSPVMFTKVIAGWFDKTRGLFLGIAGGLGNGLGSALTPLLILSLITAYGWRGGYQGLALTILIIGFPTLFLLLWDPPRLIDEQQKQDRQSVDGLTLKQAMNTSTFWMILIAVGLVAGCMTALFAHLIPMLVGRGLEVSQATTVLIAFSLVTAAWQIGVGYLLDRIPKAWIAAPFYIIALAGLILLELTSSYPLLILSGVLLGFGLGTEYGVLPYFLSRYFGVKHYGAISGVVYSVVVLTQGLAPVLMGLVFDMTGTYQIATIGIAMTLLLGAILLTKLRAFKFID